MINPCVSFLQKNFVKTQGLCSQEFNFNKRIVIFVINNTRCRVICGPGEYLSGFAFQGSFGEIIDFVFFLPSILQEDSEDDNSGFLYSLENAACHCVR